MNCFALVILLLIIWKGFHWKPSNVLSCGQWGYIGDSYNPLKIKILGLYNQTRGVHSCGVHIDNQTVKGTGDLKLWMDFIAATPLPATIESGDKVILGHARQASSGSYPHNAEKQHPFHIGNKIGQQNGTIKNDWDLARKYKINRNEWEVDTQLLYTIMDRHGYDVLEEYTGFAALMWKHADTPNELFVFKGASPYEKDDKFYVERPLYYLREDDGYYFSSMPEALDAINDDREAFKVETVPHNSVMRLYYDEENIIRFQMIKKINRDLTKAVSVPYNYKEHNVLVSGNGQAHLPNATGAPMGKSLVKSNTSGSGTDGQGAASTAAGTKDNIVDLTKRVNKVSSKANMFKGAVIAPEKSIGKFVTHKNGRFFSDDKLLNGIFRINSQGKIEKPIKGNADTDGAKSYQFFAGLMFENHTAYMDFCRQPWRLDKDSVLKKHRHYFRRCAFQPFADKPGWVIEMSKWSKYPVKVMPYNCSSDEFEEKWFHKGELASEIISCPPFTDQKFYFLDGGIHGKLVRDPDEDYGIETVFGVESAFEKDSEFSDEITDDVNCKDDSCENQIWGSVQIPEQDLQYDNDGSLNDEDFNRIFQPKSLWDAKFDTVDEYYNSMSIANLVTLHYYVDHMLNEDDKDTPGEKKTEMEVKDVVATLLETVVKNKSTIREQIQNTNIFTIEQLAELVQQSKEKDNNTEKFDFVRGLYLKETSAAFIRQMDAEKAALASTTKRVEDVDEINSDFEDEEDEDDDEDGEDDDEIGDTLAEATEDIASCCEVFTMVSEDLGKYADNSKCVDLRKIITTSNDVLKSDLKEFIENRFSEQGRLVSKLV